jgi:hypothetical protein
VRPVQRVLRISLKALGWLTLALLVVVLAWVASNGPWADAAPQASPPALQQRPVTLAPAHNGFVALQAVSASDGPSWPQGPVWDCPVRREDCVGRWLADPAAVREAMQAAAPLGARCEQVAQAEGQEEVVAERPAEGPLANQPYVSLPMPSFRILGRCVTWFGLQAAVAATPVEAVAALARADRLARLALAGSRSLIGTQVSVAAVERAWLQAAGLAVTGRVDRRDLLGLLAPLPPAALSPRLWAPHEARFAREVTRDLVNPAVGCGSFMAAHVPRGWLDHLVCRYGVGLLPEQTAQDNDARWAARLALLPAEGPAACEQLDSPPWRETDRLWPSWRNTIGRWMLDVPGADWGVYAARQLDLELLRQTLSAQVLGQHPPGTVSLTRENGALRFAACRARRDPGQADATLRLPLI